MDYFKTITSSKINNKTNSIIMGYNTWLSIDKKPLENRTNIVITRQSDYKAEGCDVVNSVEEALEIANQNRDEEPFIIGGGQIYKIALEKNLVDRVYLTRIHQKFDGDTFFPELDKNWKVIEVENYVADEKNKYDYSFLVLEKK